MLNEVASKLPDIYVGLGTGLVCTLLGLMIDRYWSAGAELSGPLSARGISMTQIVNLSVEVNPSGSAPAGSREVTNALLAVACITYLLFRDTVLDAGIYATLIAFCVWTGTALHSLYVGRVRGLQWPVYMAGLMGYACAVLAVFGAAASPDRAPVYFAQWQEIMQHYGLTGLLRVIGVLGIAWLVVHVAGILVLFLGLRDALLSMYFNARAISHRERDGAVATTWLLRLASRYARPYRTLLRLAVLTLLAYLMISGDVFYWLTQGLPQFTQWLMQTVLFGNEIRS